MNSSVDLDEGDSDVLPSDAKGSRLILMPYLTCVNCKVVRESEYLLQGCYHPICSGCVGAVTLPNSPIDSLSKRAINDFPCPTCECVSKKVVHNPFSGLPVITQSSQYCKWCLDKVPLVMSPAFGLCEECECWMCSKHIEIHNEVPSMKNHSINANQIVQDYHVCKEHGNAQLSYFCQKCLFFTCPVCQLNAHKGHPYCSVEERKDQVRAEIKDKLTNILEDRSVNSRHVSKRLTNARKELQDSTDKAREEIVNTVVRTAKQLGEWHDEMMSYLASNFADRSRSLESAQGNMDTDKNKLDYLYTMLGNIFDHCQPHDVILLGPELLHSIEDNSVPTRPGDAKDSEMTKEQKLDWIEAETYVTFQPNELVEDTVRKLGHIRLGCVTSPKKPNIIQKSPSNAPPSLNSNPIVTSSACVTSPSNAISKKQ